MTDSTNTAPSTLSPYDQLLAAGRTAMLALYPDKAKALGVAKHVSFLTDYLDDADSMALLRDADLVTYAYQQTGESSSAAVRMGLASGVPVAVTPLTIFGDVAQATFRLPGVSPESLAAGVIETLDQIKAGNEDARERAANAAAWCASHDVRGVAATSAIKDAYTQPGRNFGVSLAWRL